MEPLFELEVATPLRGSRQIASGLFRQLKSAILGGRLPAGSRLPSTRGATSAFGVSRNTAQDVYDRLAQEGLVVSRHGSGTYIAETRRNATAVASRPDETVEGPVNAFWERPDVRRWIGFWHEGGEVAPAVKPLADLRPALVDQRLFPHATFRQVMARQLRRLETNPASSRSPQRNQGNNQLRRAIAEHVGVTRAVACRADDLLITSGAQQAFDLVARTLVTPGRTVVAVEDPGYPPMRVPFAAAGAAIVPVRVDHEGIVVDEIPADATIVCVCPSHQFPLGMPMSPARRKALLRFAHARKAVIVEDDYDGEFRYEGSPMEALRSDSSANRVYYVGSLSKCMFPSVRLGFIVPPSRALPALVAAKNAMDWHCSVPVQAAAAGFILDGHLARHIRRVRRIYRDRRNYLLNLLDQEFAGTFSVIPSFYGMHISVVTTEQADCAAISRSLAERGIMIHSLDRYFLGSMTASGFIIGYASADLPTLQLAVEALAHEVCAKRQAEAPA